VQIVTIDLLGTSFTVQTDESLDYMESLLSRLRARIEALKSSTRVADPLKLSILLNITLLDELMRERSKSNEQDAGEEISRVAARLIADIDRSLEPPE
jgi:cell division protein ZapA (FtsZ GTPase activity inhibitor)